jgi:hypothetical protein
MKIKVLLTVARLSRNYTWFPINSGINRKPSAV